MNKQNKRVQELEQFAFSLGLQFKDIGLLDVAFTHPSCANEHKGIRHNQRLEFLGDAVLDVVVSDYLFHNPDLDEGMLTKIRANFVEEKSLAHYAAVLGLGNYLLVGRGSEKEGDRSRPAVLADTFEAVVGAIYKDRGLMAAKDFVLRIMQEELEQASRKKPQENYKSLLQEELQKNGSIDIKYVLVDQQGPCHEPIFTVEVSVRGKNIARGSGKSKRLAEQQAAERAFGILFEKKGR